MAHFLEHLVFKGGEKFAHYRDVNETAERLGAVLNAFTSHDIVAFHITARAERALEAADLLTDFVGRPQHRRRRARPRARRGDPGDRALPRPALDAGRGPDRPGRLRRPPAGAAGARPRGPPAHVHPRRHRGLPRAALVGPPRRGVPGRQPRSAARERGCGRAVRPLPGPSRAAGVRPRSAVRARVQGRTPRVQPVAPAHELPARGDRERPAERAALAIYATLLGGSMGSRLFDEIREQRGLAYSVAAYDHAFADVPILQLSAGLDSTKTVEAYQRMREIVTELRDDGPTEGEVERARAYAAGRRVLAFENTGAVARHARLPGHRVRRGHGSRRCDRRPRCGDLRSGQRGGAGRRRQARPRRRGPTRR